MNKIKILVSLFAVFSLFSLNTVNAMQKDEKECNFLEEWHPKKYEEIINIIKEDAYYKELKFDGASDDFKKFARLVFEKIAENKIVIYDEKEQYENELEKWKEKVEKLFKIYNKIHEEKLMSMFFTPDVVFFTPDGVDDEKLFLKNYKAIFDMIEKGRYSKEKKEEKKEENYRAAGIDFQEELDCKYEDWIKSNSEKDYFLNDFNKEVKKEQKEINAKELYELENRFLNNFNYNKNDEIFENIMCCFGYDVPGNEFNSPANLPIFNNWHPNEHKYKKLENGKKTLDKYDYKKKIKDLNIFEFKPEIEYEGKDCNIFSDFEEKRARLGRFFNVNWPKIIRKYYPYCFEKTSKYPNYFLDKNGEEYEVSNETLEVCFTNFVGNFDRIRGEDYKGDYQVKDILENFRKELGNIVKYFLSEIYLKSLFMAKYKDYYDFSNYENIEYIKKFSEIFLKVLKCKFSHNLKSIDFELHFDEIKSEEDKTFLKLLYEAIEKREENPLLYDLYKATYAFLQNKYFWNKMFRIIIYLNTFNLGTEEKFEGKEKIIFEKCYDLYKKNYFEMKDMEQIRNNPDLIKDCYVGNNDNLNEEEDKRSFNFKYFNDCDFKDLRERFKTNIFMYKNNKKFGEGNKNFFDYYNKKGDYVLEELNVVDGMVKYELCLYGLERFPYSIGIKNFETVFEDNELLYKLLNFKGFDEIHVLENYKKFNLTEEEMLKCLGLAAKNTVIRKECFDLIRYMFKFFLTYNFIKMYGNKQDENNVLILKLANYFEKILDVNITSSGDFGLLKLRFEKPRLDYEKGNLDEIIEKFRNEKNLKKFTDKEKLIYRLFLTAKSFVNEEKFWSRLLGYLIFKQQLKAAEIVHLDSKGLYDEYKKLNKESSFLDSYISEKYKLNFHLAPGFEQDDFLEKYNRIIKEKEMLDHQFKTNLLFLSKIQKNNNLVSNMQKHLPDGGYRYVKAFSYEDFEKLINDIIKSVSKNFKADYVNNIEKFKFILENETIANECMSFIKYFFKEYMLLLASTKFGLLKEYFNKLDYNQQNKFKRLYLDKILGMLKWYNKSFRIKVEDGKLKFELGCEDFDLSMEDNLRSFAYAIENFKPTDLEAEKFGVDGLDPLKEVFCKVLYSIYLNAFAFLNSEDFWNNFMGRIFSKKLENLKGKKGSVSFNSLLDLNKELLDVLEKNKNK